MSGKVIKNSRPSQFVKIKDVPEQNRPRERFLKHRRHSSNKLRDGGNSLKGMLL